MTNLVALPVNGMANSNQDLAAYLRGVADQIEKGEHGDVHSVLVTFEGPGHDVYTFASGNQSNDNARVLGLLHLAAAEWTSVMRDPHN